MDNNIITPGAPDIPPATPPPMPSPAPDFSQQPAPAAPPAPQAFAGGGVTSNKTGLAKFFDGVTVTDVVTLGLFTAVSLFAIVYYRKKIEYLKKEKPEVKKKIEEIEMNVVNALGSNYRKI